MRLTSKIELLCQNHPPRGIRCGVGSEGLWSLIPCCGKNSRGVHPPPDGAAADPLRYIFTAVQELGLRLESAKGRVEVLVVDSAEKPEEN
jgi:uncharacterized protein (TIGR03435 family)